MTEVQILAIQALIGAKGHSEDDFLKALRQLQALGSPSVAILKKTKIGKSLHSLAASATHESVRSLARTIEQDWRRAFRAGVTSNSTEKPADTVSNLAPKRDAADDGMATPPKKPRTSPEEAPKAEHLYRDRVRKLLYDAVSICHRSVKENLFKDKNLLDDSVAQKLKKPDILAEEIERALHDHMPNEKDYRAQARSIAFNLKDDKNSAFRFKLLLGHVAPHQVPMLTAEDMASDATRMLRERTRDEATKAVDLEANSKNSSDSSKGMFPCEECQSENTINFQIPSGKPDTAPTIVVICAACGHRTNIQDKEC
eukprot:gnl/TRDRNA2_/TRDRNA2_128691_c0_seq1.p1 gnl/TRDRNA2_/TRDRNA2_128691_c0~~gnl/TRDRNA2_/TRDRNA2_128691_c0_seq1.p1  ORF type:complete len:313 (+),score=62.74 gnl/TRDRNA2_/TRDRNA2_128691_c0_seq1:114-1052(+)